MIIYYLYKKTHQKTGLKYLGYTKRNPYTYTGSGSYWSAHLKKHGYAIDTEILLETDSKDEIKIKGQYYSTLWNIVNAKDINGKKVWANLKPEAADGGSIPRTTPVPKSVGRKISKQLKGRINGPHTDKRKQNIAKSKLGIHKGMTYEEMYGKKAKAIRKDRSIKLKKYINENPDIRAGKNNGNAKFYEFISPGKQLYSINGSIVQFCKQNSLNLTGVYKCINGQVDSYKDWQIKRLNISI